MDRYEHNSGTFIGKGGVEIFFQNWLVKKPKALLFIAHGLGEHSGRYTNIVEKLRGTGFSIISMDHRGHGRSGGKMGHINSFGDYLYDMKYYMNFIREEYPRVPIFLLGHSLGGLIACSYALNYPDDIVGLILSAPALIPAVEIPAWKIKAGKFFSKYVPGLSMSNELDPNDLSHDAEVVRAYTDDPFVHSRVTARFYTEFVAAGEECLRRAHELSMPLLIFHGDGDKMVHVRGSEEIYIKAATDKKNKQFTVFGGLYHETMNESEPEREKVLDLVRRWLMKQLKPVQKKVKGTVTVKKASQMKKAVTKKAAERKKKPVKKAAPSKKTVLKKKKK